jgi:nicotinamide phosphoribosyltransferase
MTINPIFLTDGYKFHHYWMYPEKMNLLYSNFTPRKSRIEGVGGIIFVGLQRFLKKYLIDQFNEHFFGKDIEQICEDYERVTGISDLGHIRELHALGYLPLEIRALPEGTFCPIGVPAFTVSTTSNSYGWFLGWVTNYLETLVSAELWPVCTAATIADQFRRIFEKGALQTVGNTDFVPYQGHNFSMRGCYGVEAALLADLGHVAAGFMEIGRAHV